MPRIYSTTHQRLPLHLDLNEVMAVAILPNRELAEFEYETPVRITFKTGTIMDLEFKLDKGEWGAAKAAREFEQSIVLAWRQ